ncbi:MULTISPECIES: hexitol phosphatase HxpB [unclassified Salinivibrio]|uniref:hexitol phosphatase HxpB n=1 Tax=unclassified Salinivibrio TaxID=2636825 RepID=UPI000984B4EF|nr:MULTISPECIES: hexitol phosphatase HxpB [unclassified Salinivibrio]OOF12694.1 2-deoxyglucose-6-phosphatase [Salinivibrio sp. PR919]OOF18091.1 2-deoxyglucose-6-phosphatase [Salinivibrio sp. PR932]
MLSAAVFDMDGLLVDSEPFWQRAQIDVLSELGVSISLQDTRDTTGVRIDEIVKYYARTQPWQGPSNTEVRERIVARVVELVQQKKPMMPGVKEALAICRQAGLKIGLASSSPLSLIHPTLDALGLSDQFSIIESAGDLKHGKPHPEVYLNAAQALDVEPEQCIAFEDSFTGLLAAKAASMKTIVVPAAHEWNDPRFVIADHKLESLSNFTPEML